MKTTSRPLEKSRSTCCCAYVDLHSLMVWFFMIIAIVLAAACAIALNQSSINETSTKLVDSLNIDRSDSRISWDSMPTHDIELTETVNITESGTFHLTGVLEDGSIDINSPNGQVRLILDNVSIKNHSGPTIYCQAARNFIVELIGENYLGDDQEQSGDTGEETLGAIYSKADLVFQGNGSLTISANYLDGVVGKDNLEFNGGTYIINSKKSGIKGKDSVYIVDGNFIINSSEDAIKATNKVDPGEGFILIEEGNLNITSSLKGLDASNVISINGGSLSLNTFDDALNSDGYIGINGATINIVSGDDAIHANHELIVDDGEIIVARAKEGLESRQVRVNGGSIKLTTIDDGINASGDTSNDQDHKHESSHKEEFTILINGGELYINAEGDGMDSNGWIYFNGGKTVIDGPTNSKNGALDATMGIITNGGQVVAVGSSEMAGDLGATSSVYNISVYFTSTLPAGTNIEIKDKSGNVLFNHSSAKPFVHLAAASPSFSFGEEYYIYLDSNEYQAFTITNITTVVESNKVDESPL